jgi:hypothetical protein
MAGQTPVDKLLSDKAGPHDPATELRHYSPFDTKAAWRDVGKNPHGIPPGVVEIVGTPLHVDWLSAGLIT